MSKRRKTGKPRGPRKAPSRQPRRPQQDQGPFNPRVNAKLKPILAEVGVPDDAPFVPDPFQVEAVETLAKQDVVVSAPTGSGKTWIAEQAIAKALAAGQRAWYASPLKALSNAKLAEFGEIFGPENVGILTGDRKENLGAPLLVGTTEILRNQLYDAMHRGMDLDSGLVVLDEAHFLGDPDRGVVWEEVIIYLPVRVRLLLLSATVANASQIARWLEFVRDEPCATVISNQRPVPLYPIFMLPDGELTPLKTKRGLFGKVQNFVENEGKRRRGGWQGTHLPPFQRVLASLDNAGLLPAIFFLKSRSDCDTALSHVAGARLQADPEGRERLNQELDAWMEAYPFLAGQEQVEKIRQVQAASHHAGHLPLEKLLVERLMQKGLLKAIFSTSTVAAGVNFPARTVVITQSDRFNGREFVELKATDLLQMTGRAGRRGMDEIGFACAVPGPFNDIPLVASLLTSEPEPIESQLHINFSMVLNLLLSQRPAEVKKMLGMSLATFQRLERTGGKPRTGAGPQRALKALAQELDGTDCPGPEEAVVRRRRRRQLEALRQRLKRELKKDGAGLWGALSRGRVFMDMYGAPWAVLRRETSGKERGVLAVGLEQDRRLTRGRPRLQFISMEEVAGVFQEELSLPQAGGGRALAGAVMEQAPERPTPLGAPQIEQLAAQESAETAERLADVEQELSGLVCLSCPVEADCRTEKKGLGKLLNQAEALMAEVAQESHAFWYDFVRHLEFLRAEGFADPQGRLTDDGLWASQLRLDQPVLIAEAIRQGALPQQDPVLLAGLIALFVDEREPESAPAVPPRLRSALAGLKQALDPMMDRLRQWGFTTPVLPHSASAAVYSWCQLAPFEQVVPLYGSAEGDLAQLIYRTADNLRQIISLKDTHPHLAETARDAVELLLRPPVVVPT
ncbi:MAG: DEAD/DEAH box helicase [Desulfarculaceae bacterium]|nr:DEAD/DEAH box helicase [Desulfarculaceae bacterium]MCF8072411.1 DEAD/DEAH box helicase [Desulfarculaceae bacterium]MCF8100332.1 DEAD/DEAH box helicase [Desulfarculaceae bacterium]MCF8117553.1 DEAD/DEAH box helicase [Desulfarculaceae bacterium]